MIFDGEKEQRAIEADFDYIIVGSGAAGATAARVLADTDASIALVEEGPAVQTAEFVEALFPSMRRIFRDMTMLTTRGRAMMPIIQGSCLGGSTVVNSGISWRIPDDVWEPWRAQFGLGDALPLSQLHAHWDLIERELAVQATPRAVWGENNRLMDVACSKLHVSGFPTQRNVRACHGSARCLTGCPFGAKQSMLVSYVPYAEQRGATLFTSARVDRISIKGEHALGVRGHFHQPTLKTNIAPFTLRARKAVIVAASAIQTPLLLHRSGVRAAHLGQHFQAHPGCSLVGVFDQPVRSWFGATQGYEVDEHRGDGRFKVESIALPLETLCAALPGVGVQWLANIADAPHMAIWAVQLRAFAEGTVRNSFLGTEVRYDLTPRDMANLRRALRFTAELLFAAGAREIITGVHGMPERLHRPDDLKYFDSAPADPAAYTFILSHLFGTARMSVRAQDGVVGTNFCVHDMRNLYVVDSSLFPTNLGVNPQLPIMGVAMHAARQLAEREQH